MAARRTARWAFLAVALALAASAVWAVHGLRSANILRLQACAEVEPQPIAWLCREGLYRFHPTADEVRELNTVAGALFAVDQAEEGEARKLLKHWVDAGLDVNAADQRVATKWTALHVMASEPNPLAVRILLEFGADPAVTDTMGRTPADLARANLAKLPKPEYEETLRLLAAARH